MFNHAVEPPTWIMNEHVKTTFFDLLKPMGVKVYEGEVIYTYNISHARELTVNLMYWLGIPYDSHYPNESIKMRLEDFTEEERRLYYPFAFILASLDGNAFRTGQLNAIFEDGDKADPSPTN